MNKTQLVDCIQAKLGEDATKKCAEAALTAVLGDQLDNISMEELGLLQAECLVCSSVRKFVHLADPAANIPEDIILNQLPKLYKRLR